jgi:hypothetical protein
MSWASLAPRGAPHSITRGAYLLAALVTLPRCASDTLTGLSAAPGRTQHTDAALEVVDTVTVH